MPANSRVQALIATCFTWGMTAHGAALVFAASAVNRKMPAKAAGILFTANQGASHRPRRPAPRSSGG